MVEGKWPKRPLVYEINTWVWLRELSSIYGQSITLANIPSNEWDAIADLRIDAVWLMGVWERSPASISISMADPTLLASFRQALPDFAEKDNVGSPYSVRRYVVDERLGGREGLAFARKQLAQRGMRLLLDFVPNHVAPDNPWAIDHPEYFIQGTQDDLLQNPAAFLKVGSHIIALGKDLYFPAWSDVLQLNIFHPGLRQAVAVIINDIASQCDGLRCDMAMLQMASVFEHIWGERCGEKPSLEYWQELIVKAKEQHPDLIFIAEAYWDLEWDLMQQGFDYAYDKRLYDRLASGDAKSIRLHLQADISYQERLVRFIENHDEPRAAAVFPPEKERASAVVMATLPGAKLIHEGQLQGRKVKLPVFLGRRFNEPEDAGLKAFYQRLLQAIQTDAIKTGEWQLCTGNGWPDNQSYQNLLAWCWQKGEERRLIVINFSSHRSQGLIQVPWKDLAGDNWCLKDMLADQEYIRNGSEMLHPGLYVDLEGWQSHFFIVVSMRRWKEPKMIV